MIIDEALDEVSGARAPKGYGGRFYGAYPALVTSVKDQNNQGRVQVSLPWSPDGGGATYEAWARLATTMAGNNRGSWFIPDVNDEVLVVFLAGDPRHPCVVGGFWNGADAPPVTMDPDGKNDIKRLRSRAGVQITLDDSSGQENLLLETPGGQKITLKDGTGVWIEDSNGNSVKLESAGITVTASAKVTVNATQVAVSAPLVTVDAGTSTFSGLLKADSIITNSIISASYTPGAGNIW